MGHAQIRVRGFVFEEEINQYFNDVPGSALEALRQAIVEDKGRRILTGRQLYEWVCLLKENKPDGEDYWPEEGPEQMLMVFRNMHDMEPSSCGLGSAFTCVLNGYFRKTVEAQQGYHQQHHHQQRGHHQQ